MTSHEFPPPKPVPIFIAAVSTWLAGWLAGGDCPLHTVECVQSRMYEKERERRKAGREKKRGNKIPRLKSQNPWRCRPVSRTKGNIWKYWDFLHFSLLVLFYLSQGAISPANKLTDVKQHTQHEEGEKEKEEKDVKEELWAFSERAWNIN